MVMLDKLGDDYHHRHHLHLDHPVHYCYNQETILFQHHHLQLLQLEHIQYHQQK